MDFEEFNLKERKSNKRGISSPITMIALISTMVIDMQ